MSVDLASRAPTWQLAVTSFLPVSRRRTAHRWLAVAPVAAILIVQAIVTLRLNNIAFSDEALYIGAGHRLIAEMSGGPSAPGYGSYFSGFPWAYPVIAAGVDSIGGLRLVRLLSMLLMLCATLAVGGIAGHLAGSERTQPVRLLAMIFFICTGSVLLVGNLATFDSLCVMLVAASCYLALTRTSVASAALSGALIASAGIVKYTGAAFIPVVILLAYLATHGQRRSLMRAGVVAVFALGGLLAAWLPTRQLISAGISLTTTNRAALNYRSLGSLAWELGLGIGLLIVVALVGGALFWRESPSTRRLLTVVTMVGAGLALPISQMRLHEYTSFNKHLAFAALFLAPLAAQSIARRGRPYRMLLIFVVTYVLAVGGLYRSATLFSEWPDSTQVSQYLQTRDEPGQYVAVDAETMAYESPDHPELQWTSMFALYGAGPGAIHDAVGLHEFTGFIYRSGSTGDNSLDSNTAYLDLLLRASPNYQLVATFPVHQYDQDLWYVWIKLSPGSNGGAANHPEAARPATP